LGGDSTVRSIDVTNGAVTVNYDLGFVNDNNDIIMKSSEDAINKMKKIFTDNRVTSVTKDIISPVKRSVEGLEDIIKEYENLQMEEVLLPLIPTSWGDEMKYFTKNEFDNKIEDKNHGISSEDMNKKYNEDKYNPVDGEIIEVCDQLAAFIEATLSINYGITSKHLEQGRKSILDKYGSKKIAGIDFRKMFEYFKEN
jgi:putative hydrolase of HD superfamily